MLYIYIYIIILYIYIYHLGVVYGSESHIRQYGTGTYIERYIELVNGGSTNRTGGSTRVQPHSQQAGSYFPALKTWDWFDTFCLSILHVRRTHINIYQPGGAINHYKVIYNLFLSLSTFMGYKYNLIWYNFRGNISRDIANRFIHLYIHCSSTSELARSYYPSD